LAVLDAVGGEVRRNRGRIEPAQFQRKVIHVVAAGTRRRAAQLPERARDGNQIDQRSAGAQLHESDIELSFYRKRQRVAVERERRLQILYAQYDVIDRL